MKTKLPCKQCGADKSKYYAKGLCKRCYNKQLTPQQWSQVSNQCLNCGTTERPHFAYGLCERCYHTRPGDHLCECGCGLPTSHNKRFRKGHWLRTQGEGSYFQTRHIEATSGANNYCYGKTGKDHPAYGHYTSPETRELRRQTRLRKLKERITKPTDIEIILARLLDELHIQHDGQHIINGKFAVDEFVPSFNLIIEAFGGYWHGDPRRFPEDRLDRIQLKNISRDKNRMKYFKRCEYKVLVLWEKDLKENPEWCKQQILSILENQLVPLL